MFIGIFLFLLGLAFLLKNLGVLSDVTWSVVWSIILMAAGLVIIFRKKKWWE